MKTIQGKYIRGFLLLLLGAGVAIFRWWPGAGEWYAQCVYPKVSYLLSWIAAWIPYSLCEFLVIATVLFLGIYPFWARKRKSWKLIFLHELEVMAWIFVWFYWGWGANYFRDDFFRRSQLRRVSYQETQFQTFLSAYAASLNAAFLASSTGKDTISTDGCEKEIKRIYQEVPEDFGLSSPYSFQHPKRSIVNRLYSSVGVLGYMGPFFAESHVNHELLPVQYPFTYAHELSHLLGVSSEAEANFWAYQICTRSSDDFVRYSGYVGILPYVISNAHGILGEPDFRAWLQTIHPDILKELRERQAYWNVRYSELLGKIQSGIYNFYLKGNRISSGQKNYAEVIGMILSVPENWWSLKR